MIRTLLKPLSFIPAILLIYMIFSFSSQEGDVSSQLSYKVSYKIVQAGDYIFDAGLDEWQIDEWANKIHFITRKLGHMAEYFALAVAVSFPLYVYGLHGFLLMLVAGALCVGIACADEYYQTFVAGRTGVAKDVLIDSVGIFFGIIVVRIIGWTGRKTIFRPKKPKQRRYKKQTAHMDHYDDYPPNRHYPGGYNPPPQNYQGGYTPPPQNHPSGYNSPPQNQQNRYSQPEESFIHEPEYGDEWNVNVSDTTRYAPEPENEALAHDWGQGDQHTPDVPPPYNSKAVPRNQQQRQAPPAPPQPKPQKKKEKDWFFDM